MNSDDSYSLPEFHTHYLRLDLIYSLFNCFIVGISFLISNCKQSNLSAQMGSMITNNYFRPFKRKCVTGHPFFAVTTTM